ncbi:Proline iminopeptidase [Nymphaea thermarum]|nr:Proline iminopeptidase [Nymphaea thermarum]
MAVLILGVAVRLHRLAYSPASHLLIRRPPAAISSLGRRNVASMSDKGEHTHGRWCSVPDLRLRDHWFSVPLDYTSSDSSTRIFVFAREVVAGTYLLVASNGVDYSPSSPAPNLIDLPSDKNSFLKLVKKSNRCHIYYIFKVDRALNVHGQLKLVRGTGLSTPLTVSSLSQIKSASQKADFLQHFRADNIVRDAEFVRVHLVPNAEPWTVLGQSFGGFCAVTYLSIAPEGLKSVLLTGGLPPIGRGCTADTVYRACFEQIIHQNEKYYQRFPEDIDLVREVVIYLEESEGGAVPLPSGGLLTARGLQSLGLSALGSSTGFERLHYMFERVWDPALVKGAPKRISYFFLKAFEDWMSFDRNPLYAILHESIYCQGASSRWSAQRVRDEFEARFNAVLSAREKRPIMFTGEMIFPWMFDEIHALRPLKEAAHLLAEKEDWPLLYDIDTLKNNKVPVAAAVYYEDMYVNFKLAMDTASQIAGIRLWITNEYMHSGLRDSGSQVFDHLMGMLKGKRPLF